MPPPQAILALLPNWLGDVAMCTPALRALRNAHPDATLTVAGKAIACELLADTPWIDRIHTYPARASLRDLWRTARDLAPSPPDACAVFPHSFRAALLARMTRARRRAGQDRAGRAFLLTDPVAPQREAGRIAPVYMAHEYLAVAAPLGATDDGLGLELHANPEHAAAVHAYLPPEGGPVVGIAPGAAFGPSKCWPPERYAAVADALAERAGARCILLTGPGEEATRAAVLRAARHPLLECHGGAPSIARLKATIARLDLLIGNDSGPRHIAIAFNKPVICIMGPTSPRYTDSPWERGQILRVDVDCGPCQQPTCATDHRCMTRIDTPQVTAAALQHLP